MGFSVTIASAIVLIGMIVLFGSIGAVLVYSLNVLSDTAREYLRYERDKLDVKLELEIETITQDSCTVNVKNLGTKTIFLRAEEGFQWNTIMISYQNNATSWPSYPIESYTVLEVVITGTQTSFDPTDHNFINPGEEARISFDLPEGAPPIPKKATVIIVFASRYGVIAQAEGES